MSRVRIKLCGVRTPADALLCAEAGADEIGVVFAARSRRRVTLDEARAIRDALPRELPLVGVFLDATADEVDAAVGAAGLAAVQLHGRFFPTAHRTYAAVQVQAAALPSLPEAARVLLDGPAGGSGKSFAWELAALARAQVQGELFIAGGLTPDNVAQAIAAARPDGVDVASGIEGQGGFKDPARVRAFVQAVRG